MNGEKIGKECIICFIGLEKDDYCMLDCAAGHLIHYSCIDRWIKKGNKRCPIDRMELKRCIHAGMVEVFASPVPENQRCFLCNEAYEPKESPILKCKICRINPCHSKCLQEISTDMLSLDFNAKQVCENCSYQVRQLQIFERMHIIALRDQYRKLERAKKKIDERQASILESIQKYENRFNSMEED